MIKDTEKAKLLTDTLAFAGKTTLLESKVLAVGIQVWRQEESSLMEDNQVMDWT